MSEYDARADAEIRKLTKRLRELMELPGMTKRTVAAFAGTTPTIVGMIARGAPVSTREFIKVYLWAKDQPSP